MTKRKSVDMNAPVWFDGTNINEALFCDEFLSSRKIIFANGAFFTPDGRVTDDLPLRGEIYEELKCCAVNNIPRKITNILEVMKLAAHVEDFAPEADRIHLANGTLKLDGSFTEGRPDIVRSRLPVAYRPDARRLPSGLLSGRAFVCGGHPHLAGVHRLLPDSLQQGTAHDGD